LISYKCTQPHSGNLQTKVYELNAKRLKEEGSVYFALRQKHCKGYLAFSQTRLVEMVT